MDSPKFSLDRENAIHIFRVFLWSVGSAVVAAVIAILQSTQVPTEYMFLVPVVNTALVTIEQYIREQIRGVD